jgi:phage terminase large subunit-like protein
MAAALEDLERAAELAAEYAEYVRTHKAEFWPWENWSNWQRSFFAAGRTHRERMVLAGNRTGKTLASTYEDYLHATGLYPDDWEGLRFTHAPTIWVLGVDAPQVKDVLQSELFGSLGEHAFDGTGWIPADLVRGFTRSQQLPGLARDVAVQHARGGQSLISFRSYSQSNRGAGTTSFAGSSVDFVHVDEQPSDPELHGQLITRTMTGNKGKGGSIVYTMTPELGYTELIRSFMEDRADHQHLTQVTWADCPHLTPQIQKEILASIPEWQREMRRDGIPFMGSGRIYTTPEERITVEPFEIPDWWTWLAAIDFGISHPTAWAKLAYNPEDDVVYLVSVYRRKDGNVDVHAPYIRGASKGFIPTVYPHDGDNREKGSGKTLAELYREAGVDMSMKFRNLDKDKSNYVEPGISVLDDRMRADRFKVFSSCREFFEEYRRYHRDENGKIVKKDDDVLDAVRYGAVMIPRYGIRPSQAASLAGGGMSPGIEV